MFLMEIFWAPRISWFITPSSRFTPSVDFEATTFSLISLNERRGVYLFKENDVLRLIDANQLIRNASDKKVHPFKTN